MLLSANAVDVTRHIRIANTAKIFSSADAFSAIFSLSGSFSIGGASVFAISSANGSISSTCGAFILSITPKSLSEIVSANGIAENFSSDEWNFIILKPSTNFISAQFLFIVADNQYYQKFISILRHAVTFPLQIHRRPCALLNHSLVLRFLSVPQTESVFYRPYCARICH